MWRMLINTPNREPLYFFYFKDKHFFLSFFFLVLLEKTRECPLDCKEIQPDHPRGNQSWIFIGRTDAEAPILWPNDAKNRLTGKNPDAGKDWRWEEKETDRGWNGWMASAPRWIWVWVCSGRWWWTGRPGVLQSMGPQRVRHDWATEMNWLIYKIMWIVKDFFLSV